MPKHKQTASLGNLSNYTTPSEQPPLDTEAEITALKKRVYTLEFPLNDVMHQLDKATQARPRPKQQPKPSKPKRKPTQTKQQQQTVRTCWSTDPSITSAESDKDEQARRGWRNASSVQYQVMGISCQ